MPWFLVERLEVHKSMMLVQAESPFEARDAEGTEVELEYHRTLDEGRSAEELTDAEAAQYLDEVISNWEGVLPGTHIQVDLNQLRTLKEYIASGSPPDEE